MKSVLARAVLGACGLGVCGLVVAGAAFLVHRAIYGDQGARSVLVFVSPLWVLLAASWAMVVLYGGSNRLKE